MASRIIVSLVLWSGIVLIWEAAGWELELWSTAWWFRFIGFVLIVGVFLEVWTRINIIYKKLVPEDERA